MSNSTASDLIIVKLDGARLLLAEARDAGQAKQVADLARAAEVYAKRQKLSQEAIDYATAVKVDAMTLLGEFLKAIPKATGGDAQRTRFQKGTESPPTLSEVGVSKRESSDAQALARLKEKAPDVHEQVRNGKTTVSKARREVQRQEKREKLKQRAAEATPDPAPPWRIIEGDCRAHLGITDKPNLIFADPPYNIGVDYGDGAKADSLPDEKFVEFCSAWLAVCYARLAPDGSLWVLIGDEYAADVCLLLRDHGFHRRAWVKWYETFGVCNSAGNNFSRCSRHLFYCVKDQARFTFNVEAVTRPSDRQTKYDDARANPGGKVWDDVWGINPPIPRLTGTCAERLPDFPTQLPLALLRPIVGCSSNPGDLVLDPFSGSATTGVAALEMGRRYIGIEKQPHFAELSTLRLKGMGQ